MQTDIKNEFLMNHAHISYTLVRIVQYKDDQCITMANVSIHFIITQPTVSQTRPPEEKPRPEAGPMKQNLQAGCQTVSSGHPQMIPPLHSPEHTSKTHVVKSFHVR